MRFVLNVNASLSQSRSRKARLGSDSPIAAARSQLGGAESKCCIMTITRCASRVRGGVRNSGRLPPMLHEILVFAGGLARGPGP